MGMKHRVYVGPYIRCTTQRVPQKITFWGCASDLCDLVHTKERLAPHVKFCPHCGGPCGDTEVDGPLKDAVSSGKLYYMSKDRLAMFNAEYTREGVHLFVPNQDWPREFTPGSEDIGEILANAPFDLIKNEIEWISTAFAEEIKTAKELYEGEESSAPLDEGTATSELRGSVEVCWGVLAEYC